MPGNTTLNATLQAIAQNATPIKISLTPMPTPIPEGMTTTVLDWQPVPIFGVTLWAILALLSLAALVIIYFHWSDKSANLDAIKPWFIKIKEIKIGKMQVIRLSRAGNFIPDCLDIFDNVLSYGDSEENINQWHLNSPQGIIKIAGISAPIISEDWDQNRDIVTELAVCHATELMEKNIENFKIALTQRHKDLVKAGVYPADAENPADLIFPIRNGLDYIGKPDESKAARYEHSGRRMLELIFPRGIPMDAFNQYNQNRFRKFWFKGSSSALMGGINLRRVDDEFTNRSEVKPGFFERYGGMLIGAIILLGLTLLGSVIPLG